MIIDDPLRLLDVLYKAYVEIGFYRPWWRGHADSTWKLLPHAYRGSPDNERDNCLAFMSKAPARYPTCPTTEIDWLFLMQHYGLPTRLLDWTESPLIALFFAVWKSEHDSVPGTLWVLNTTELNKHTAGWASVIALPHISPQASSIAAEALRGERNNTDKTLAIYPPHTDIRMLVQRATSTIHATDTSLEQLDYSRGCLLEIEIPSNQKAPLRTLLSRLGIDQSVVFPDLEHLAKALKSR